MARWLQIVGFGGVLALGALAPAAPLGAAEGDQGFLAGVISRLLSTPENRVVVGAVEGALSSNAVIRDVTVADEDGVYLRVGEVRLTWSRTALFTGRLLVNQLVVDNLTWSRRPLAPEPTEPPPPAANEPLLPQLPVEVIVERFEVGQLVLGEGVVGVAARLNLTGRTRLGDPASGLDLAFAARRLDAPGRSEVSLRYDDPSGRLAVSVTHDEPAGGLVARLIGLPDTPPVRLTVRGDAPIQTFDLTLDLDAGPELSARGSMGVRRVSDGYRVTPQLVTRVAGVVPQVLRPVVEGETRLSGDVIRRDEGSFAVDALTIASATSRVDLAGRLGADSTLDARLRVAANLPDGDPERLGGRINLDANVTGTRERPQADASLDVRGLAGPFGRVESVTGRAQLSQSGTDLQASLAVDVLGLLLSEPTLARAVGDRAILRARADRGADAVWRISEGRVATTTTTADVRGSVSADTHDLQLDLRVPDLTRATDRVSRGRLEGSLRLAGDARRSDARANLRVVDVVALERRVPELQIDAEAGDVFATFDARVSATGRLPAGPLDGRARIRRIGRDGVAVEDLTLNAASVALTGAIRTARGGVDGQVSLKARDLDDVSPLLLLPLRGSVDVQLDLTTPDRRQSVRIVGRGADLLAGPVRIGQFDADLTAIDPSGSLALDGRAALRDLRAAGGTVSRAELQARRTDGASDVTLAAEVDGARVEGAARILAVTRGFDLTVSRFEARRGGERLSLAGAAEARVRNGTVDLSGWRLESGRGALRLAGRIAPDLDLTADAERFPLAAIGLVAPGAPVSGILDGRAAIAGSSVAPRGEYRVTVTDLATPDLTRAGLPRLRVEAQGRLGGGRVTTDARLVGGADIDVRVTGSAPVAAGRLDLATRGRVDLRLANASLGGTRSLAGAATLDLTIGGTTIAPEIGGRVTVANGRFTDAASGFRLDRIEGIITARGSALAVERLGGVTPDGGTVALSGTVTVDAARGFPADLKVVARRARLASTPLATAVADLDLSVTGALATAPRLAGQVTVVRLDLTVPGRIGQTSRPLPNARHIAPPEQTRRRLAVARRSAQAAAAAPAVTLDLTVSAPNRIFVRGRGIDAELGGDLRLTGTAADPVAIGAFDLRRGRLDILGQRLSFTRGQLAFGGSLVPVVDFVAETQAADVTARIAVTGPTDAPSVTLSSAPELPSDEILSRILFRRATGGLSGLQALQLAQALATLSGDGEGGFDRFRRALGVDALDITTDARGGPALGVSRYITDNVRVGVRGGATPEQSGVTVDVDLTRRLRLQGEVGADGRSSVGVAVEVEY